MPPAKKTVRRSPAKRSVATSTAVATQTMTSTKLALATLFLGFSAMAAAAMGTSTPATSTPSVVDSGTITAPTSTIVVIAPSVDTDNISRIITPTSSAILAKWNLASSASTVVKKIRFSAINGDYTERTNATEFGTMTLRDGAWGSVLATAQFQSSGGYVEFSLPAGIVLSPNLQKSLSLHGQILDTLKPNTQIRFGVSIGSANAWQVETATNGAKLPVWQLRFNNMAYGVGAPGPIHLFHVAVPQAYTYVPGFLGGKLDLSQNAPIFPITFANRDNRAVRLSRLMVKITTEQLVAATTSPGAVMHSFKLWGLDSNNKPTNLIASAPANVCIVGPLPGGPTIGTRTLSDGRICNINQAFAIFDKTNPGQNQMANLTISPYGYRQFIVTADTLAIGYGKSGSSSKIKVKGEIAGVKGPFPSSNPKIPFWGGGGISYHYTPATPGATENITAYNQSDNYPVVGPTFSPVF